MTIGDRIRKKRKELGMSADDLAVRLGKDRSTIYRYEKGDIESFPVDILDPIAVALRTTPGYLMGWISDEEAKKNGAIASAVNRMENDPEFFDVVTMLDSLSPDQYASIKQLISVLAVK